MKVLLAVDGSPYTKHMLAFLAVREDMLSGEHDYTVLTVVPRISPNAARFLPAMDLAEFYRDEGRDTLAPVQAFLAQKGWKVEYRTEAGPPAEVIATVAQTGHFDLLVMGSHGHAALGSLVLGSVTTGVLARCSTPVLLIRQPA